MMDEKKFRKALKDVTASLRALDEALKRQPSLFDIDAGTNNVRPVATPIPGKFDISAPDPMPVQFGGKSEPVEPVHHPVPGEEEAEEAFEPMDIHVPSEGLEVFVSKNKGVKGGWKVMVRATPGGKGHFVASTSDHMIERDSEYLARYFARRVSKIFHIIAKAQKDENQ